MARLRKMGFVDVENWTNFSARRQRELLAVLRNDPQATELE